MTEATMKQTMTMEWMEVTPELAGQWLMKNQFNRNESATRIRRYAKDMTEGEWKSTHQPLAFDEDGNVLDGQNRLQSVIRASNGNPNFAVGFWVCFNAPRESFYVVDTGKPRSLSDALTIHGEPNARHISSFTNLLWRITPEAGLDKAGFPAPNNPPTSRALAFWDDRKHGLREAVPAMNRVYYHLHGPSSAYGALFYRFAEINNDDAVLFYERLALGTHMAKDDPILVLRNHIIHYTKAPGMHHLDRIYIAALMTNAWNRWRESLSTSSQHLAWKRGGASPRPFPLPR